MPNTLPPRRRKVAISCDLIISPWGARFGGRFMPCAIGRAGIGIKRGEGDKTSPRGRFRIMEVWYRPDRMHFSGRAIGPDHGWSDDPHDPLYNSQITRSVHRFSHEALRRGDGLYDLMAVLDYNYPQAEPGKGSAIFLHCWRKARFPTAGCVAFDRRDLRWILSNWSQRSRVVIRSV